MSTLFPPDFANLQIRCTNGNFQQLERSFQLLTILSDKQKSIGKLRQVELYPYFFSISI